MIWQVNYQNFVRGLFPYFLRKAKNLDFLNSMIKGLQYVNDLFVTFRNDNVFQLAFNGQIIYLEKYLNLVYLNYDVYPNNIYIIDGANVNEFFLYNKSELQTPVYFYNDSEGHAPVYLENKSEQTSLSNYTINIPTATTSGTDYKGIPFDVSILKNRVNKYNNAGKTYEIVYF